MRFESAAAKTPGTDEWWMDRLAKKLGSQLRNIDLLEKWMEGKPPLPYPDKQTPSFRRLQEIARINLAEVIISAMTDRMQPLAMSSALERDSDGDDYVRKLWDDAQAESAFEQAIEWMLVCQRSALMVGRKDPADPESELLLTAEHPSQIAWEVDPRDPSLVVAALKIYRDDINDQDVAVLFRPGYQRIATHRGNTMLPKLNATGWSILPTLWELDDLQEAPLLEREIPVYPMENRLGLGEFERHLPTLQRINHTILQRMVIVAMQAFRQRAAKGAPYKDKNGEVIDYDEVFENDPGSIWILPAAVEMWESGQADLTPVLSSVKDDLMHLAVASRTPMHMLTPDASGGSAEGAAMQREATIFKVEKTMKRVNPAIRRATAAMLRIQGETDRAELSSLKVDWANPRRSSLTERAESARGAKEAGVPWEMRMLKFAELTPSEVAEAKRQRAADNLQEAVMSTARSTSQ